VELLKKIEKRALESIITDLLRANADTLRITAFKDKPEISLPLVKASTLIKRSVDMIASIAQSIDSPKAYFQSRYPKNVDDFLGKLEMGHTERGSFVVAIHARVKPRIKGLFNSIEGEEMENDEPFERRVMTNLSRLISIAINAANKRTKEDFESATSEGMSANFCESLADITEICGNDGAHFDITWAPSRPIMKHWNLENKFFIRPDTAEVLREVGTVLRQNIPEIGVAIKGYVVRLDKNHHAKEGEVKISDILSERPRNVFINLRQDEYHKALNAHAEGCMVSINGDLEKFGRKQILTNPTSLKVIPEENEE